MKKKLNQPRLFEDPPVQTGFQPTRPGFPVHTHGAARHTDPETSKIAAANVKADKLERVVLHCLYKHGNRTAEEITDITGVPIDSITPRTAPLVRKLLIVPTKERRRGASKAKRIVWALTDLGREFVIKSIE